MDAKLIYVWEECDDDIYHGFSLLDPEKSCDLDQEVLDVAAALSNEETEEAGREALDSGRMHWNTMNVSLPDSLVERIKQEGVAEYLAAGGQSAKDTHKTESACSGNCMECAGCETMVTCEFSVDGYCIADKVSSGKTVACDGSNKQCQERNDPDLRCKHSVDEVCDLSPDETQCLGQIGDIRWCAYMGS